MINSSYSNFKLSKFNLFLLLFMLGQTLTGVAGQFDDLDELFAEFHKDMLRVEERLLNKFQALHETATVSGPKTDLMQVSTDIKDDGDWIIVTLRLPAKLGDNSITIEAKERALKGTVAVDNYDIKFAVINNGWTFSYSCKNSKDDKSAKGNYYASSESYQQVMLPAAVADLENTQTERQEQVLILRLPKLEKSAVQTAGWTKLTVK